MKHHHLSLLYGMNPCIEYTFTCKSILTYCKKKYIYYRVSHNYLGIILSSSRLTIALRYEELAWAIPYLGNFNQFCFWYRCILLVAVGRKKAACGGFLLCEVENKQKKKEHKWGITCRWWWRYSRVKRKQRLWSWAHFMVHIQCIHLLE